MPKYVIVFICTFVLALSAPSLEIGGVVDGETFKDIRYLPRTLNDLGEHRAYLLAFTTLEQTASQAAMEKLKDIAADSAYGEAVVAVVNVSPDDSIVEIAADAVARNARYTVLEDWDGKYAAALGVTQSPAAVVLDHEKRLAYRGNLDGAITALDEVLAKRVVATPETEIDGQTIEKWTVPAADGPVTFTKHIAPIIDQHCTVCHRPGEAAPFTLKTYSQVSKRADMIEEVVLEERMPPWYAAPGHGDFMNDRRLDVKDKQMLSQWILAGMPEGDPADRQEPPVFPESEWHIGTPDLIVTAKEEHTLPADGYIPYRYTTFEYVFTEDTWFQGIEILPSNPQTVHHANLAYTAVAGPEQGKFNFLTGRVPGGAPVDVHGPVAMMIPAGSALMLQIHYVTTGKPETNLMRVGVRYAEGPIAKRIRHKRIRPEEINIPPGDPFHELSAEWTMDTDATMIGLFSHMHLRGRDMSFYATLPDGEEETLLMIPNYSFDWQLAYQYAPGAKQLPNGTRIRTVSHYDNSAFNPYNPDATVKVVYGDQTYHEMNDAYLFYLDNHEMLGLNIDGDTGQPVTL